MNKQLDDQDRALYDACQTVKPSWDQLGEVTRGVWREKVEAGVIPADYLPARSPQTA